MDSEFEYSSFSLSGGYIDSTIPAACNMQKQFLMSTTPAGARKMARPIKETPILKGKDAARFQEIVRRNETRKVDPSEFQKGKNAYEQFGFAKKAG